MHNVTTGFPFFTLILEEIFSTLVGLKPNVPYVLGKKKQTFVTRKFF